MAQIPLAVPVSICLLTFLALIHNDPCLECERSVPCSLVQVGGGALAIIDKAEEGPRFGAEGLTISLAAGRERLARCRLGTYYSRRPDGGRSLFAEGEEIKGAPLLDLKVALPAGLSRPQAPLHTL
jgi:hypothetical protein